jgi:oligopeptide transport system substrate-binding protein
MAGQYARRRFLRLAGAATAGAWLVACRGDGKEARTAPTTAAGTTQPAAVATPAAQPSGKQEVRLNLIGEPDTLDPSKASLGGEFTVILQLWRGLFTFDKDLNLVPDLAAQPPSPANGGVSADGRTYTLKLKPGALFGDGVPVTSRHLAYALRRAITPGQSGAYATFYTGIKGAAAATSLKPDDPGLKAALDAVAVTAPDDSTLVIELDKPNAAFPQFLALPPASPLREDLIAKLGDKWTEAGNLVGNGPFVLKEWAHKDHITLVRNDRYPGPDKPKLETMVLRMLEDRNQAYNAYVAGELDQVLVPPEVTKTVLGDAKLTQERLRVPRLSTFTLGMNAARAPFDNKTVRQALATAVDREALVTGVFQGIHRPAYSWIPPGMPGHDPALGTQYQLNPAKAKQLLAEAGFPEGKGLPRVTLTYANIGTNPPTAEFVKEQVRTQLGVDIELEPMDLKGFSARYTAGDFQLVFITGSADYPDAGSLLAPNFRTNAGKNKANYSNKQFDDLVDRAQVELDDKKRLELYAQAQQLLVGDAPFVGLIYPELFSLRKPYVKGAIDTGLDAVWNGSRFMTQVFLQR